MRSNWGLKRSFAMFLAFVSHVLRIKNKGTFSHFFKGDETKKLFSNPPSYVFGQQQNAENPEFHSQKLERGR
jgi:hypothetical protein